MRKKLLMLIAPFFMASFFYIAIGYAALQYDPEKWSWLARFFWVTLTGSVTIATEIFIWLEIKNEDLYD